MSFRGACNHDFCVLLGPNASAASAVSIRCGCSSKERQMRCTLDADIPLALAMSRESNAWHLQASSPASSRSSPRSGRRRSRVGLPSAAHRKAPPDDTPQSACATSRPYWPPHATGQRPLCSHVLRRKPARYAPAASALVPSCGAMPIPQVPNALVRSRPTGVLAVRHRGLLRSSRRICHHQQRLTLRTIDSGH